MIVQGTEEWFAERCGKITASRINDVMATLKSGAEASTRKNYRAQLIAERLTGKVEESYTNQAMKWGTETEPQARTAYELLKNEMVEQVGFVNHPSIKMAGCSPDGLVGTDGLVEIKCPNTATHIDNLIAKTIPSEYVNQVQWQMDCTGRAWCDFVSFDPRMPEDMQIMVVRVMRDDAYIEKMKEAVIKFDQEIDDTISKLRSAK
jgi:putative phage-type endonuclease